MLALSSITDHARHPAIDIGRDYRDDIEGPKAWEKSWIQVALGWFSYCHFRRGFELD